MKKLFIRTMALTGLFLGSQDNFSAAEKEKKVPAQEYRGVQLVPHSPSRDNLLLEQFESTQREVAKFLLEGPARTVAQYCVFSIETGHETTLKPSDFNGYFRPNSHVTNEGTIFFGGKNLPKKMLVAVFHSTRHELTLATPLPFENQKEKPKKQCILL